MKTLFFLLGFLCLLSCERKTNSKIIDKAIVKDTVHIKEVKDNHFIFKLLYSKDSLHPDVIRCKKLIVSNISNGLQIQEMKIDTIEMYKKHIYFKIDEDVNFDGFNDICLLNYEGNYNSSFSYWLYDKKNNRFNYCKGLEKIYNPYISKERKEICSFWHSGLSEFYLERYNWENDSLIIKEKYEETWTDKGRLKITKRINDKYIVKDSIIKKNVLMFMKCQ